MREKRERVKMSRNSKTKPELNDKIQIQVITESAVTAANSNTDLLLEKRKEEAEKPIYLKRV
jgi:hypothetical protein